jgi:hypothetical protein
VAEKVDFLKSLLSTNIPEQWLRKTPFHREINCSCAVRVGQLMRRWGQQAIISGKYTQIQMFKNIPIGS